MITLTVNGKERSVSTEMTVARLLEDSGIDARIVAVEHNGVALMRHQFPEAMLHAGDTVEIVRMIGGG